MSKTEELFRPLWNKLSPVERDIMGWMKLGLDNAEIAAKRGVSLNVLKNQVSHIYEKLGIGRLASGLNASKGTLRVRAVAMLLEEKHDALMRLVVSAATPPADAVNRKSAASGTHLSRLGLPSNPGEASRSVPKYR